jgi:hypothetical protein
MVVEADEGSGDSFTPAGLLHSLFEIMAHHLSLKLLNIETIPQRPVHEAIPRSSGLDPITSKGQLNDGFLDILLIDSIPVAPDCRPLKGVLELPNISRP